MSEFLKPISYTIGEIELSPPSEDVDPRIVAAARRSIAQQIDRNLMRVFAGTTTTSAAPEGTALDIRKMLPEWAKMLRNARRSQVTFVVDMGHEGPMLKHETPCDGVRFEMNFRQAQELHRHWPIRVSKVLTEYSAEFVPVSGVFPEFVPTVIPHPPFELPKEASDDVQP